ncbi:MAG: hypothetical protein CM15mP49_35780 [Actinomycetota bacterium]|nr:MAG: hypothetical protein CM15mP49_35780 [Actinomycetota bacterium]
MIGNSLSGGADVTIDAVGSAGSITTLKRRDLGVV